MKFLLSVFLIFVGGCCAQSNCPSNISPCTCADDGGSACIIRCQNVVGQEPLNKIANIDNLCGGNVHLSLQNCIFQDIPANLWSKIFVANIVNVNIQNSLIHQLVGSGGGPAPTKHATEGLIRVQNCVVNEWDWGKFNDIIKNGNIKVEKINTKVVQKT